MALVLNTEVFDCMKQSSGKKLAVRAMVEWIFLNFQKDCQKKRKKSKQGSAKNAELIQQIIADDWRESPGY